MWAIFALFSALLLGIYDIFKKLSLHKNAVIPVLFFSTVTSSVIFLPVVIGSEYFPEFFLGINFYSPTLSLTEHLQVMLKAIIVVSSWILAFFAIKHLPVTIFAPIRATSPLWTLVGAILIFHEKLNGLQWVGVLITLIFFYLFSTAGKTRVLNSKKTNGFILLLALQSLDQPAGCMINL